MILKKKTFNQPNNIDYLVYLPDEYYNDEKSYPLVLFLHGAGERGNNIDSIKKHGIPKRIEEGAHFPFITIAPQCRDGIWWSNRENINILEKLMNYSILDLKVDKKRIYGTGLSMGGFGILELALKVPSLFTAIVAICGGTITNDLSGLENTPTWLFHGEEDDVIPVESSLLIYKHLKEKNKNIHFTTYPNIMHDSWTKTYENKEVYDWLLSFKKM